MRAIDAKGLIAGVVTVVASGTGMAGEVAPPIQPQVSSDRPDWENPAVFAINKEPARATAFPFEDRQKAQAGDKAASGRFLSLDGPWKFHFSPGVDDRPQDFWRNDYDVSRDRKSVV